MSNDIFRYQSFTVQRYGVLAPVVCERPRLVSGRQSRNTSDAFETMLERPYQTYGWWENFRKFFNGKRIQPVRIAGDAVVPIVQANDDIDDLTPSDPQGEIIGVDIPRLSGKLAALARTELHIGQYDKATEAVCKDWLMSEMRRRNMRRKDMAKILPWALKFCFVPTTHELQARVWSLTDQYQGLRQLETQPLQRRQTWYEFFSRQRVVEERPIVA